ncbi:hypothetical protein SBA3_1240007 [Candidatus Sulfopaludibacter sp. SbA3]|nr:hypothetical protein SBA3_1240007 [Candidatus Sulfopaludibacter sp. SbA3]
MQPAASATGGETAGATNRFFIPFRGAVRP